MSDAQQTAIDTLVEIVENDEVEDYLRIQAACAILDWFRFERTNPEVEVPA